MSKLFSLLLFTPKKITYLNCYYSIAQIQQKTPHSCKTKKHSRTFTENLRHICQGMLIGASNKQRLQFYLYKV